MIINKAHAVQFIGTPLSTPKPTQWESKSFAGPGTAGCYDAQ